MKINVTWADIRGGKRGKPTECMVALALKRELVTDYASVGYHDARILVNGESVKVYLPATVQRKIRLWDLARLVTPFSFEFVSSGFLTGSAIRLVHEEIHPALAFDFNPSEA